ncbi:MAG: hypothetical protein K9I71_08835 [Ignavibacteriales bacterium]|nr:hypothetical protein [Ignavibacteriales bacterium]MCF8316217.1 hypothetical protein [Ignavibacteriales bacterium]MCF8437801.1 hypothetical protein [Ignavibacteriales bacterium]
MIRIIFAALFLVSVLQSQNVDSLYTEFLYIKGKFDFPVTEFPDSVVHRNKCGTGITASIAENFEKFSPEKQQEITLLSTRPILETSILSPASLFRIHFDTSASSLNKPGYSILEFAKAADSSYRYEVNKLGFLPALPDGQEGGDQFYDIYIMNLGGSLYGYTQPETKYPGDKYTCYTVLDNDFTNYFTEGLDAAKVTIAHEYHHAIQIGNYINRYSSDGFFYEITSVSMEELVFDEVNDYLGYLRSYFSHPERSFPRNDGYNLGIWNIFLSQRFNSNILRRMWEYMPENRALTSIDLAIRDFGSSFQAELNEFGVWTYFTNYRWRSGQYFEEGALFPLIQQSAKILFDSPKKTVSLNAEALSNNFLTFIIPSGVTTDTLSTTLSNGDITSALLNSAVVLPVSYSLSDFEESGSNQITDGLFSKIETANPALWSEANIFNVDVISKDTVRYEIDYAYPQPYKYSAPYAMQGIWIPAPVSSSGNVELAVYSTAMKQCFTGSLPVVSVSNESGEKSLTRKCVLWNALDEKGSRMPSGVYFYAVNYGDTVKTGKIAIIND